MSCCPLPHLYRMSTGWISFLIYLSIAFSCATPTVYDFVILNGMVYDGNGGEPVLLDIGILNGKIAVTGDLKKAKAKHVIDLNGLAVSPGFVDLHAHLDPILKLPECESMLRQGVTTALGGPDGGGPWPFGSYLDTLEQVGVGMNVAYLVGHNQIRENIMGLENRAPTDIELEAMRSQVRQAMEEGAFGISTGLKYLPGTFSKVDEVIALSKVAGEMGGIYTSHLREEGLGLLAGVGEAIQIARDANIPVVLTHHKVVGKPMWGKSTVTLAMVDSARTAGLDVMIDQYPYDASYTSISILIPSWSLAGGTEDFKNRVANKVLRDSIKAGIVFNILNDRGGGDLANIQFAKVAWNKELEGKSIADWATMKKMELTFENGAELIMEAQLNGGASCIFHAMNDADVKRIMQHPQTMIASDGRLVAPGMGHPHPRWYGTFPRVLGHYTRDEKTLPLPVAIKKMTSMPADRLGLKDRGRIVEGNWADIVIFNPETIRDNDTFTDPHQYPSGIEFVFVNGMMAVDQGVFVDKRAGTVLRKKK